MGDEAPAELPGPGALGADRRIAVEKVSGFVDESRRALAVERDLIGLAKLKGLGRGQGHDGCDRRNGGGGDFWVGSTRM